MNKRNTTPVPNQFLDVYLKTLKPVELKVLLVIIRQTIGWQKESDWISMKQFCEKTGCSRRAICNALHRLLENQWISVIFKNKRRHFLLSHGQVFPRTCAESAHRRGKNAPPTKDTLTKREDEQKKTCSAEKVGKIRQELLDMKIIRPR